MEVKLDELFESKNQNKEVVTADGKPILDFDKFVQSPFPVEVVPVENLSVREEPGIRTWSPSGR
jgi:hypothetical protein